MSSLSDLPSVFLKRSSDLICKNVSEELLTSLKQLCNVINTDQWLVADSLGVADIDVAAQPSSLQFPRSSSQQLAGDGCPGFSHHTKLQNLFTWRDPIEDSLMCTDS